MMIYMDNTPPTQAPWGHAGATLTANVNALADSRGIGMSDLARALDLNTTTLRSRMADGGSFLLSEVVALASLFGVCEADLFIA